MISEFPTKNYLNLLDRSVGPKIFITYTPIGTGGTVGIEESARWTQGVSGSGTHVWRVPFLFSS